MDNRSLCYEAVMPTIEACDLLDVLENPTLITIWSTGS
jgi:hypothetical protein